LEEWHDYQISQNAKKMSLTSKSTGRAILGKSKSIPVLIAAFVVFAMATQVYAQQVALLIFGGEGHKEFLGCLNCSETADNSVWNEMSRYGFYNGFGTWNPFGPYKNPFSGYSACNQFANDPPVIVDREGNFYGRLSINEFIGGSVCSVTGNQKACVALRAMCDKD
jgi:hypothetical protein